MKMLKKFQLLLTIAGLSLWLGTVFLGDVQIFGHYIWPQGTKNEMMFQSGPFFGILLLFLCGAFTESVGRMKADAPSLMFHNALFHHNPTDGVYHAGPFEMRRTGGIISKRRLMNFPGGDATVIYPFRARSIVGDHRIVQCDGKWTPYRELPPYVKDKIDEYRLPGPFFIAYASHFVSTRGKDYLAEVRAWEEENRSHYTSVMTHRELVNSLDHANRVKDTIIKEFGKPKPLNVIQRGLKAMSGDNSSEQYDEERRG